MKEQFRFMRLREVMSLTGLGKTMLYEKMKTNEFPRQIAISKRSVRWSSAAVEQWMTERLRSMAGANGGGA